MNAPAAAAMAAVAEEENGNIQLHRSDGLKHDIVSVFATSGISDVISTSSRPVPIKKREEDDHGKISIARSDGLSHDIIKVFNKYYSDVSGDTLKVSNPRSMSAVGKLELFGSSQGSRDSFSSKPTSQSAKQAGAPESPYYLKKVRIIHMSDTHNFLDKSGRNSFLPHGHILVHSGNFTRSGTDEEFSQFNAWLESVSDRYHYRVVCLGSRDVKMYGNDWDSMKRLLPAATHVLCHSEATILGIRFYAAPWHWGYKTNFTLRPGAPSTTTSRFDDIPLGVHVLITHGPAWDRLDVANSSDNKEHWGSRELLDALRRVRPGVHLHGHVKDARGFLPAFGNLPLTVNSAMCDTAISVMYAAPHVIRADQLLLDAIKNTVDWTFALDSLDE